MPLMRTIRLLKMVHVYRGFGYIVHAIRMAVPEMGSALHVTVMVYGVFAILMVRRRRGRGRWRGWGRGRERGREGYDVTSCSVTLR